jgi:hypothetical protein
MAQQAQQAFASSAVFFPSSTTTMLAGVTIPKGTSCPSTGVSVPAARLRYSLPFLSTMLTTMEVLVAVVAMQLGWAGL